MRERRGGVEGRGRGGEGEEYQKELDFHNNPAWHHLPTREQVLLQTRSTSG